MPSEIDWKDDRPDVSRVSAMSLDGRRKPDPLCAFRPACRNQISWGAGGMRSMRLCKIMLVLATAGLVACDQTGKAKEGATGQAGMLAPAAPTPVQEKLSEMPDNAVIIASSV